MNKNGYCECGCGQKTTILLKAEDGYKKGDYRRFIHNHHIRVDEYKHFRPPIRYGEDHHSWKGGKTTCSNGQIIIKNPHHKRADRHGYVRESILVAERAMGKPLPLNVVIHHIDGNPANNKPNNLIVCENQGYHLLLHLRQRAFKATGRASWRKCTYCKKWDDRENLTISKGGKVYHKSCAAQRMKERTAKRNLAYGPDDVAKALNIPGLLW